MKPPFYTKNKSLDVVSYMHAWRQCRPLESQFSFLGFLGTDYSELRPGDVFQHRTLDYQTVAQMPHKFRTQIAYLTKVSKRTSLWAINFTLVSCPGEH